MKTTLLCILDGLGLNPNNKANAFALANTPTLDKLLKQNPNAKLVTHGPAVGLPEGQMGNSEVGHLHIGAGRVIDQWLQLIGKNLTPDFLNSNSHISTLTKNIGTIDKNTTIHLIGMLSYAGVHSHADHLKTLISYFSELGYKLALHVITDGRDCSPNTAIKDVVEFEQSLPSNCKIATITGRYYGMDRDKRWERTKLFYDALMSGTGNKAQNVTEWITRSYDKGITDEFLEPCVINEIPIQKDDGVIFWNYRSDRMRQIVASLTQSSYEKYTFDDFERTFTLARNQVVTFSRYSSQIDLPYLFSLQEIQNSLGEVVSRANLTQLRVAETEKYPHVTYFLNGGSEEVLPGEERKMLQSPKDVPTYDHKPQMSAQAVKQTVIDALNAKSYNLIVVNFANCDMVGHTGVLKAAIQATETVDSCLKEILEVCDANSTQALIIADHGNAEQMIDYTDNSPHTAHTTHLVPVIYYGERNAALRDGALTDVAPTILSMMGLDKPKEMTGESLLQ